MKTIFQTMLMVFRFDYYRPHFAGDRHTHTNTLAFVTESIHQREMFSRNQVHNLRDRTADSRSGHSLAHAMNGSGYLFFFFFFYRANKCCKTIYDQLFNCYTNVDLFAQWQTQMKSMNHVN